MDLFILKDYYRIGYNKKFVLLFIFSMANVENALGKMEFFKILLGAIHGDFTVPMLYHGHEKIGMHNKRFV
ncbi:hypothetical protein JM83_2681 [Gillisia sp. Hel_I_86]|uniref:hypothetical protein n=1 Tax=Gillisia sp. Hel_I_86 TaxID=1249981 RepID=UPI00119A117B|nr:hypothetical protein [Gillisia sp. Hel_I_86]TVZ27631.1 hypothetical protein JM83_2681 [Gillisia sp. Hel_I_86]